MEKERNNCPAYYDNRTECSRNKWIAKQSFPVYLSANLKTKKFNMKAKRWRKNLWKEKKCVGNRFCVQ